MNNHTFSPVIISLILLVACNERTEELGTEAGHSSTLPGTEREIRTKRSKPIDIIETKSNHTSNERPAQDSTLTFIKYHLIHPDTFYSLTELVGRVYTNQHPPNGIRFYGGSARGGYGLQYDSKQEIYRVKDSTYFNLFVIKAIHQDEARVLYKQIHSIFSLPVMLPGESLIIDGWTSMSHPLGPETRILGIGTDDERGFVKELRLAWRYDLESGELTPVPTDSITVQFDGY